ncbi:TIGR04104 family putative zinc finger protein [Alkalihalophilus lindianensis]|uniref:TIGR04104 family putative zinc finger protein n=1 Tax=Alkalihalophilus lindianensis TaxID=1630542 RepID=UPI0034DFF730
MDLPVCWSCHQRFKWRELVLMVEGKTKCSNCMETQYSTTHSKWRMGVLFLPLPFLAIILKLFSFPFLV